MDMVPETISKKLRPMFKSNTALWTSVSLGGELQS